MCGIYGFARQANEMSVLERHKLRGAVMDLAFRNESRGKDGTGVLLFSKSRILLFKEARRAGKLIKTRRFQKVIREISDDTQICLGHTRLATIGSVKNEHCHPFVTDDFAGVHNGHFMNRETILKKYGKTTKTPVDSEAVFRVLDGENGIQGVVSKLSQMQGDFALGFVRKSNPRRLYLIHNSERPLSVAYVSNLKTLFWSSERDHLEYALARNALEGNVWEIKDDHLYTVDTRNFNGKSNMRKTPCRMESYYWTFQRDVEDDDLGSRFLSYEELKEFGYLENTGIHDYTRIPCSICGGVKEAGELFYDEMTNGFLCEDCSFEPSHRSRYRSSFSSSSPASRDLFEMSAF